MNLRRVFTAQLLYKEESIYLWNAVKCETKYQKVTDALFCCLHLVCESLKPSKWVSTISSCRIEHFLISKILQFWPSLPHRILLLKTINFLIFVKVKTFGLILPLRVVSYKRILFNLHVIFHWLLKFDHGFDKYNVDFFLTCLDVCWRNLKQIIFIQLAAFALWNCLRLIKSDSLEINLIRELKFVVDYLKSRPPTLNFTQKYI